MSSERRTVRLCQKRVACATINTLRPLTRTSNDRTRSPSVSRICFSMLRLTAASVSGSERSSAFSFSPAAALGLRDSPRAAAGGGWGKNLPRIPGSSLGAGRVRPEAPAGRRRLNRSISPSVPPWNSPRERACAPPGGGGDLPDAVVAFGLVVERLDRHRNRLLRSRVRLTARSRLPRRPRTERRPPPGRSADHLAGFTRKRVRGTGRGAEASRSTSVPCRLSESQGSSHPESPASVGPENLEKPEDLREEPGQRSGVRWLAVWVGELRPWERLPSRWTGPRVAADPGQKPGRPSRERALKSRPASRVTSSDDLVSAKIAAPSLKPVNTIDRLQRDQEFRIFSVGGVFGPRFPGSPSTRGKTLACDRMR